jgi:hypothetical protein
VATPLRGATVEDIVPVIPAGIYPAIFQSIEVANNDNGTFWLWRFAARNGDEDVEVTATTSPRITPRTKASKWLTGMGVNIEVGTDIDFDSLLGMPVQLVIIINDAGYSRIESVLPFPPKGIAKAK